MPDKHAFLSASSSNRWIACPPSAKLNSDTGGRTSEYAIQGTCAHSLAEYKLKKALGRKARDPTGDLDCYDQEMESGTDDYVAFVLSQMEKEKETCPDPTVLVEQQLDLSRWIPESFGTADALIVGDDTLTIVDLKWGTGIRVDSSSSQLKCYALGCLDMFDGIYDIRNVRMVIFQPRLENVSITEMTKEDLLTWADTVLVPAAKLAFNGEGEFKAGDHCQFCSVKANCRKRAEENLELARYDFAMPPTLISHVKTIADFQEEILENDELRMAKIAQLDSLEEECTKLLGQANLTLAGYAKKADLDYSGYEQEVAEAQNWYMYQKALLDVLYKISDLRYALHLGAVSREQCNALLPTYTKQVQDAQTKLSDWHNSTVKRLNIDTDESRRKRSGFDGVVHFIPGLIDDDQNYKAISQDFASMIIVQTESGGSAHLQDNSELYAEDVQLISKDGKVYYLPPERPEPIGDESETDSETSDKENTDEKGSGEDAD